MHPIERLRYVARIGSDRPDLVAREAAGALLSCAGRPAELVVACRRLLDRQPAAGPLWWIVSRALTAPEPAGAIYDALADLDDDPTADLLTHQLQDGDARDVLTVDAWMVSGAGILTSTHEATAAQGVTGFRMWAVAGMGRVVPPPVWEAALLRIERLPSDDVAVLGPEHVDAVAGPWGVKPFDVVVGAESGAFPLAHEVLGRPRG